MEKFDVFGGNFPNSNPNHKGLTRPKPQKIDPTLVKNVWPGPITSWGGFGWGLEVGGWKSCILCFVQRGKCCRLAEEGRGGWGHNFIGPVIVSMILAAGLGHLRFDSGLPWLGQYIYKLKPITKLSLQQTVACLKRKGRFFSRKSLGKSRLRKKTQFI